MTTAIKPDSGLLLIGLSWDPNENASRAESDTHDLDLSCALIDSHGTVLDFISPINTKRGQYAQSIFHGGDNMAGGSDFEDEFIRLNLTKVADNIHGLAFFVSTKNDLKIKTVDNPVFEILHEIGHAKLTSLPLKTLAYSSAPSTRDVVLTGIVVRHDSGGWAVDSRIAILDSIEPAAIQNVIKKQRAA